MSAGASTKPPEDLLFRRQFVLAPRAFAVLPSWPEFRVGPDLLLHVHPELEVTQAARPGLELTLLGYVLDPHHPALSNREILTSLLDRVQEWREVFEHTEPLGGRWVLILHGADEVVLFSDPAGLRQIFYTDETLPHTFCASQPATIAETLGLTFDATAVKEFLEPQVARDVEYWWPGDSSAYAGVRHLIPNHYLCLRDKSVHRFWPRRPLPRVRFQPCVTRCGSILQGLWGAARHRFALAHAITAGLDSRTVLAANRDGHRDVYYYTLLYRKLTEASPDVCVPARLLGRLDIPHHVIRWASALEGEFAAAYQRNVTTAHADWGRIIQGLHAEYPQDRVAVHGVCSEIARCGYYYEAEHYPQGEITPRTLAHLAGMAETDFILRNLERWLVEAHSVERDYGIRILDLFYWEQRVGNWAAMAAAELDITQETFSPFNHREFLAAALGLEVKYRQEPHYRLYRRIIQSLWPEVLALPINPGAWSGHLPRRTRALRDKLRVPLQKLGLYSLGRRLYLLMCRLERRALGSTVLASLLEELWLNDGWRP